MTKITHVAVAILQQPNGNYLLASRPQGKPWAGWWEFPGGKIELGEAPEHALKRELQEELGITPTRIQPWLQRIYNYPETHDSPANTVHLHFFFVTHWHGDLHPHEGQELSWQNPASITVQPVLPANAPIMKALALPPIYAITNLAEMGEQAFFSALKKQLNNGLQLIQVREKHLQQPILARFTGQVIELARPFSAKVLLNGDMKLAREVGADGVHLSSIALMNLKEKPSDLMVTASCHNASELAHAQKLGLDFVVLSPVKPTKSHENAEVLGWQQFTQLIKNIEIPVYALGGMTAADLPQALSCGARGIAMQRAVWDANSL
jgi:8-oxo-dGTP diphosphatase